VSFSFTVSPELVGRRLDVVVVERCQDLSRGHALRLIKAGSVTVDGAQAKPAHRLRLGEEVKGEVPEREADHTLVPEEIPLVIIHEDEALVVIDKPAGLVVHPAPGHRSGTLVHALLHHYPELSRVAGTGRPGIVHRLDKGTSGLLVAAKTERARRLLAEQFRTHTVDREYLVLVRGSPKVASGTIDRPIGRHPTDRKRFTADARLARGSGSAREAVTRWKVEERFGDFTLLRVRLETGRTHQVRVHLVSVGLPVVGDPVYGGGRGVSGPLGLDRPALHAAVLGFDHPETGARMRFEAPPPADLEAVLERIRS
jgi:23S rRNA pseudouridine1911/1915/1917 synthase